MTDSVPLSVFLSSFAFAVLAVCLRSLSCWKMKPLLGLCHIISFVRISFDCLV